MTPIRLAIVGATGMVGQTTLAVLQEWNIPLADLRLYASSESAGKRLQYGGRDLVVEALTDDIPADFVILALSADLAREWAPRLAERGLRIIDHSSAWRMDPAVPLVIPEINAHTLVRAGRIVANPNCSASVALMGLAPLERAIGLRRVIAATYQSVSGAGIAAVEELRNQNTGESGTVSALPRRICGNVFPEIGSLDATAYTGEETKIAQEIRKILERPDLHASATAVRVPVEVGHAVAVSVELARQVEIAEVTAALCDFPGLINDGPSYATPLEIAGKQDVRVGRVRLDPQDPNWLHFWIVGDNTRKGAASNAVQILQHWANL
ncbi:MAG: aspartate-semialdehyde dehydrogenase [bacterium]|nr:aspartate-semialdehyde dehydrogenase [bacterium]